MQWLALLLVACASLSPATAQRDPWRLVGHVVDADGSAVPDASVVVVDARGTVLALARTDEGGRFALTDGTVGSRWLHARHEGRGASVAIPLQRSDAWPVGAPELVLAPAPPLSGRLLDPAGTPRAGIRVEATRADLAPSPYGVREELTRAAEYAGGLARAAVTTDALGRFTFRGLQRAPFRLHAPAASQDGPRLLDLVGREVTAGEPELLLHSRTALVRVQVVDAQGRPLAAEPKELPLSVVDGVGVGLLPLDLAGGGASPAVLRAAVGHPHADAAGRACFPVSPGLGLRAFAFGDPHGLASASLTTGGPGEVHDLTLALPEVRASARIVVAPDAPPPPAQRVWSDPVSELEELGAFGLEVRLVDPFSGRAVVRLAAEDRAFGSGPYGRARLRPGGAVRCPPGSYLVRVGSPSSGWSCGSGPLFGPSFASVEVDLELRAGSVHAVCLPELDSATLMLRTHAPLRAPDGEGGPWLDVPTQAPPDGVRVTLTPADGGGRCIPLEFSTLYPPYDVLSYAPLGEPVWTHTPVRPGRYVLEARLSGCLPEVRVLDLEADGITELTLVFRAAR